MSIVLNQGEGGKTLATATRGGEEFQKVVIEGTNADTADAFGRLRISEPFTIFDSKLITSDKQPLFWDESLETGAGITSSTPTAAKPYIDFTSTLNTAGKFTRQTFRRFNYQPGKSQLVLMTGVLDLSGGGAGVERRIGAFDDDNGVFFEDNAGVIGVTYRSNDTGTPVDTTIAQASWNIDTMDGGADASNPSGYTADWTKAQIFVIDFQWLSVGRIRFGLDIGGHIWYVHEVNFANTQAIPWASTPNLPLRYQIITTASSPASTMRCICNTIISEGGADPNGLKHSHATTAHVNANVADTIYALLGIRLKTTALGITIEPESISALSETTDSFEWMLIFNPTVAGTFTFADKTNSAVQTATGDSVGSPSANTVTGGTIIDRGFVSTTGSPSISLKSSLVLGAAIDGTRDELVLAVRPLGTNADIQGSLTWREL